MDKSNHLPLLRLTSDDFRKALFAVNRTKRFILFVPRLSGGGEALIYPKGSERGGQKMTRSHNGKIERGVVFFNGKDKAWQSVRGDGNETIIINDVTLDQANALHEKQKALRNGQELSLQGIKAMLAFAKEELGIIDFYNKHKTSVLRDTKLITPSNPMYRQVNNPAIHKAIYVPDGFVYDGPVKQVFPNGAVMVNRGNHTWGVATDVFLRGYKAFSHGKEEELGDVKEVFEKRGFLRRV